MKIEWKKLWAAIVRIAKATWKPIMAIVIKEAKKETQTDELK